MSKGRYLVSTLSFFQRATKGTHDLAIKFIAKKPEHVRNCEGWASGPNKRFGIFVPGVDKFLDGLFQVLNAEECAQTNTLARQLAKPAFHQVQPTGAGGYKC